MVWYLKIHSQFSGFVWEQNLQMFSWPRVKPLTCMKLQERHRPYLQVAIMYQVFADFLLFSSVLRWVNCRLFFLLYLVLQSQRNTSRHSTVSGKKSYLKSIQSQYLFSMSRWYRSEGIYGNSRIWIPSSHFFNKRKDFDTVWRVEVQVLGVYINIWICSKLQLAL